MISPRYASRLSKSQVARGQHAARDAVNSKKRTDTEIVNEKAIMNDQGTELLERSSAMRINLMLRSSATTHGRNVTRSVSKWREVGVREQGERRPMEIYTKVARRRWQRPRYPARQGIRRPTARVVRWRRIGAPGASGPSGAEAVFGEEGCGDDSVVRCVKTPSVQSQPCC